MTPYEFGLKLGGMEKGALSSLGVALGGAGAGLGGVAGLAGTALFGGKDKKYLRNAVIGALLGGAGGVGAGELMELGNRTERARYSEFFKMLEHANKQVAKTNAGLQNFNEGKGELRETARSTKNTMKSVGRDIGEKVKAVGKARERKNVFEPPKDRKDVFETPKGRQDVFSPPKGRKSVFGG